MAGAKVVLLLLGTFLLPACTLAGGAIYCGCALGFCCCSSDYSCGIGCGTMHCPGLGSGVSIADAVTRRFFDRIIGQANAAGRRNKGFYTRQVFLDALNHHNYSNFEEQDATVHNSNREVAVFFAHSTHHTGYFCNIEETNKSNSYCIDVSFPQYPLEITSNKNYDGFNSPKTVSNDFVVSFKNALWFWMNNAHGFVSQGFGATIRIINGTVASNSGNLSEVNNRVNIYKNYCSQFGVTP